MRIRRRRLPRIRLVRRPGSTPILKAFVFLAFVVFLISLIEVKIKPIVYEYAYNQTVNLALSTLNESVSQVIDENQITYKDLVNLVTDNNGSVSALISNTLAVNDLKTKIIASSISKFDKLNNIKVKIPFGQITGSALLSSFGPEIYVSLVPVGSIKVNFGSDFSSAGINQTLHKIYLDILAVMTIIMPGKSMNSEITVRVDVAETVIVGIVPSSYTNVGDDPNGEITDKIFNFADID